MKRDRTLNFCGREYSISETEDKTIFREISNTREVKVNFSFSKDPEKNKKAEEGLRIFWTEVFG